MSDLLVFAVGVVIFAITVYGTVMAGGISLTRRQLDEHPGLRDRVNAAELQKRFPVNVKY